MSIQQLMETDARRALMDARIIRGLTLHSPAHTDAVNLFNDLTKLFVVLEKKSRPETAEIIGYELGDAAKWTRRLALNPPSREVFVRVEEISKILSKILTELRTENPTLYRFVMDGVKAGSRNA